MFELNMYSYFNIKRLNLRTGTEPMDTVLANSWPRRESSPKRARKMYSTKSKHRNLPDRNIINCYSSKFYTTLEIVISA